MWPIATDEVAWFVCLLVTFLSQTDRYADWRVDSGRPKEPCIRWGSIAHYKTGSFGSLLFCSLPVLGLRVGHTTNVISAFISIHVVLFDSSMGIPVHVLMLSIQALHGLLRLHAPGIVPCIISFFKQLPCFLMVWPYYASFLALTVSNSYLFTPALLRIY